jgi:hypothetical protein
VNKKAYGSYMTSISRPSKKNHTKEREAKMYCKKLEPRTHLARNSFRRLASKVIEECSHTRLFPRCRSSSAHHHAAHQRLSFAVRARGK